MNFFFIAVGTRMPAWVTEGYNEYLKRLPRECTLKLKEIEPAKRGKNIDAASCKSLEEKRIQASLPKNPYLVALDVQGSQWSTEQLASKLERWQHHGQDVVFLAGGADGLDDQLLESAQEKWSLSALTFPHPIVRIILIEQFYRAWSLSQGHPYHRG